MGSAKLKTHFLSTSPFFNPCVFWEKFNSYVSDLFTCKSSECCFVLAIWCPGRLLSFSFEVFSPRPRIRKQWFANSKKARGKKSAHQIPQYFFSKVQIVLKTQIVWSLSTSLTWQMYFGVPNWHHPWSYSSLPRVYAEAHTCSGWLPWTDPKKRWQALQDEVNRVCNLVSVDKASRSPEQKLRSQVPLLWKQGLGFSHGNCTFLLCPNFWNRMDSSIGGRVTEYIQKRSYPVNLSPFANS